MKQSIMITWIIAILSVSILIPFCMAKAPEFEIKYAYWNVEQTENGLRVEIHVAGTSPGAEYMEIRFLSKYYNGSENWTPWLRGPFDYGYYKNNTTEIRNLYFSPTADDWLAWEYFLDETIPYTGSMGEVKEMDVEVKAILNDGSVVTTYATMDNEKPVKEKDPRLENPTYTEINISVTEARVIYRDRGNFLDVEIYIAGKGDNVSHVALNFIITYKNGSRVVSGWMGGPFNFGSGSKIGLNYSAYYFLSESGRWKRWEFRLNGTIDKNYAPSVYWYDDMVSLRVYARAYLDNTEILWNQDSRDVSLIEEKSENTGSNQQDIITIAIASTGVALILIIAYRFRKRS